MSDVKKVTCRSSRAGIAKHNDRQFDMDKAPHIDQTKTKQNVYWHCYKRDDPSMSFADAELKFYTERYGESLDQRNERHRAHRQYKRVKTMADVIKTGSSRPDETVLQIGNMSNNQDVTRKVFAECVSDYMSQLRRWSKAHGDHVHMLDCAVHLDEASPHAHLRTVVDYTDADGVVHIGQEEGLKQSGLELPDPSKPVGRHNNRKMTYTAMCREMWADICEAHGYTIDRTPDPNHRTHLSTPEWQQLQEERRALAGKNAKADEMLAEASGMLTEAQEREARADKAIAHAGQLTERLVRHYRREGLQLPDDVSRDTREMDQLTAGMASHEADPEYV